MIRRSQILLLSYFQDASQRWHPNPLMLQLGQLFVLSRIYLCWAELEFLRPSSFQFGSSPSGGTYSLAILFFLVFFFAGPKFCCCSFFAWNCFLSIPSWIGVRNLPLEICKMLHKMRKQSKHHRLSSPSNRQITLLCWWPGKKERPMTDYILNPVFSSPLHSMANIMLKWHNTAPAKKSVKQISETFGIEFICFLCRTNMWPTTECSCCGWVGWPFLMSSSALAQLGLFLWGPRESGTLQFNSNFPVYSPNGHRTSLSTRQDAPTNNAQVKPWESKRDFPDYYTDEEVSYLWVGQILPS